MLSNILNIVKSDSKGFVLILISSVLLGIWATSHTIALRNGLLWIGALLAIWYWFNWYQDFKICLKGNLRLLIDWLPLILIALMFIWVIAHFLFFSQDAAKQLQELKSTWLRSFLAFLIGSAVGLAIQKNKKHGKDFLSFLWLGILISFLILFIQYLPKAVIRDSLFASDHFGNYIYWAKFNGVLIGCILLAGLVGLFIDYFLSHTEKIRSIPHHIVFITYTAIGIILTIYSFVFIFDAKVGIGVVIILITFWGFLGLIYGLLSLRQKKKKLLSSSRLVLISAFLFLMVFIVWASKMHVKHNIGWGSLLKDVATAVQIDQYTNWQNTNMQGYPDRPDGVAVIANTYERAALATAGLKVILHDPIGYGTLRSFPQQIKKFYPNYQNHIYTHSAWIDLGLAFGFFGFILIPCALLVIGIRNFFPSHSYRSTILSLTLTVLVLYAVGEYGFQHGVEVLFFLSSFLATLAWEESARSSCVSMSPK